MLCVHCVGSKTRSCRSTSVELPSQQISWALESTCQGSSQKEHCCCTEAGITRLCHLSIGMRQAQMHSVQKCLVFGPPLLGT